MGLTDYTLGDKRFFNSGREYEQERTIKLLELEIQKLQGNPNDQLVVELTSRFLSLIKLIKGEQK